MSGQQPVKKFQAGPVSCALFENQIEVNGQTRKILKATINRRYKDRTGTWKSTNSYSRGRNSLCAMPRLPISAIESPPDRDITFRVPH